MSDEDGDHGTTVILGGKTTPLVLTDLGPRLKEKHVASFERRLGYALPPAYREFLLRYNGGEPVSGEVLGRDHDPNVPYAHGDAVSVILKLSRKGFLRTERVEEYEALLTPGEHPWGLPDDVLPIGYDSGGNAFVLELGKRGTLVRFVDHERLDEPIDRHRVLADGFLDFTMRFRSVEAMRAEEEAERKAERTALESGAFPAGLEAQCRLVEDRFPEIRAWLRAACAQVFDMKGHFSLHDDPASRLVFDAMAWLSALAGGRGFADPEAACSNLTNNWFRGTRFLEGRGHFGLTGYAPGFVAHWWKDRTGRGLLAPSAAGFRLTASASEALVRELEALARRATGERP